MHECNRVKNDHGGNKKMVDKISQEKVYVYSGGCSSNLLSGEQMINYLEANDYSITESPKEANYIIVNTCAVDKISEDRSINVIDNLKKQNPNARVVIAGCLPSINKKRIAEVGNIGTFGPKNIKDGMESIFDPKNIGFEYVKKPNIITHHPSWNIIERYNAFDENGITKSQELGFLKDGVENIEGYDENAFNIQISQGCRGSCSYCAIKKAIGPLKSESLGDIISLFENGVSLGYDNFKIWADDLGVYGQDIGTNFATLLGEMIKVEGEYKLELLCTNPNDFLKQYDRLLPSLRDRRVDCLNISLQSGSERVLKNMNRSLDVDEFIETIKDLRQKAPHLEIRSHYMSGFPGENWKDFFQTIDVMYRTKIYKGLFLEFDPKPDTPACDMPNQISLRVKNLRRAILENIGKIGSIVYLDGKKY